MVFLFKFLGICCMISTKKVLKRKFFIYLYLNQNHEFNFQSFFTLTIIWLSKWSVSEGNSSVSTLLLSKSISFPPDPKTRNRPCKNVVCWRMSRTACKEMKGHFYLNVLACAPKRSRHGVLLGPQFQDFHNRTRKQQYWKTLSTFTKLLPSMF